MKTKNKLVMLTLMILGIGVNATAQSDQLPSRKARFSLEIDPATFLFKGYSAHIRFQPKQSDHLLLGVGIYAMDMPSFLVDLNKANRDVGWNVRLNRGLGVFGEYHFTTVNKGWLAGAQISLQEYRIKKEGTPGNDTFVNPLVMAYGGYTIQPFKLPVYFKTWAGIGYTSKVAGDNTLEGHTYDVSPVTMFATLHIGYTLQ